MNLKRLWVTVVAIFALSAYGPRSPGVRAQQAACRPGWEWNTNSLGQDPCYVVRTLENTCRGIDSYPVPLLRDGGSYEPPRRNIPLDLTCECNTVTYSLYMGCIVCQNGIIYGFGTWAGECDDGVNVTTYPHDIPEGTAIPRWAFNDVTALPDQTYNDTVAMNIGRDPEVNSTTVNTLTSVSPTSTRTSSGSNPNPTGTSDSGGGRSITGAIAGGTARGVGFIILGVVVLY